MKKFSNQMDVEHVVDKFMGSLSGFQSDAYPVYSMGAVTENLTYIQRNEKGLDMMGQDPHWDRPHDFQGYVRAPLDRKVADFGFIWDEHIYNVNPLAGTGSDNINFLAGGAEQQLSEMALLPEIEGAQGNPLMNEVTNVLDPSNVQSFLHNREQIEQAVREYQNTPEYQSVAKSKAGIPKIDVGKRMLDAGQTAPESGRVVIEDRNKLQSQGLMLVNDVQGRHPTHTRDGQPISYFLDGSITQAERRDDDPLHTEPIDREGEGPKEWQMWFGYKNVNNAKRNIPFSRTAAHGSLDEIHENLLSNNYAQKYLTSADMLAANNYTLKDSQTKQMFLDYDRPFDPLPLQLWDANDNFEIHLEKSQKKFDLERLK